MAITFTAVGTGARATILNYDAGTSLTDLMSSLNAWIVSHGWTQYYTDNTTYWVYRCLQIGGNSSLDNHYNYVALKKITEGLVVESWLGWSGSAGITKAENLSYALTSASSSVIADEGDLAQPVNLTNGGYLELNHDTGVFYLRGVVTAGASGNIVSGSGTLCVERIRTNIGDSPGGSPSVVLLYPPYALYTHDTYSEHQYKWSQAKGIDGLTGSTNSCGLTATLFSGSEFFAEFAVSFYGFSASSLSPFLSANKFDGQLEVNPVRLAYGGANNVTRMGPLKNCARLFNASNSNYIRDQYCDSNGIPSASGTLTDYQVLPGGLGLRI